MKLKKSLFGLAVLAAITFTSCVEPAEPINSTVTFYDADSNALAYQNGDTNVDPHKVAYIDIKFDKAMDRSYAGYIFYNNSNECIYYLDFITDYVLRIQPYLFNDQDFKIVFNDEKYNKDYPDDYSKKDWYLRDVKGHYIDELSISFRTKPSAITHPHTFEIDTEDYAMKFAKNEYDEPGRDTQIFQLRFDSLLDHEKVMKGDKLIVNYKLYSTYDLHNIHVTLFGGSRAVNYWNLLAEDMPIIVTDLAATTDLENPNYCSGTVEFPIIDNMSSTNIAFQFWAENSENPEFVSINLVKPE